MVLAACGSAVKVPSALEELRKVSNKYVWPTVTIQILMALSFSLQVENFGRVRLFRVQPRPSQDLPFRQRVRNGCVGNWQRI